MRLFETVFKVPRQATEAATHHPTLEILAVNVDTDTAFLRRGLNLALAPESYEHASQERRLTTNTLLVTHTLTKTYPH